MYTSPDFKIETASYTTDSSHLNMPDLVIMVNAAFLEK